MFADSASGASGPGMDRRDFLRHAAAGAALAALPAGLRAGPAPAGGAGPAAAGPPSEPTTG